MAVQDPTTNYTWLLPDVSGDVGAWGAMLRTIIGDNVTGIDTLLYRLEQASTRDTGDNDATRAMKEAGGVFTDEVEIHTDKYALVNSGNLTGGATFDLSAARFFYGTVTGAVTSVAFTNVPASGKAVFVVLELTNGGSAAITWGSIRWPGGSAPTLQASGVDVISLYTRDGGTTWRGALMQGDSS